MNYKYTQEQVELITQLYPKTPTKELARILGIKVRLIYYKANAMGLKKDRSVISETARRIYNENLEAFKRGQFKKGHTTWNKVTKGLTGSNKTSFKQGQLPHNTKYDGCINIRRHDESELPYYYIRVAKGKWRLLHRIIWEDYWDEKLPPTTVVRFKDGNTLNIDPENLLAVSREQHMLMNSFLNLPKDLIDVIRVKARIKRKITKINRKKAQKA